MGDASLFKTVVGIVFAKLGALLNNIRHLKKESFFLNIFKQDLALSLLTNGPRRPFISKRQLLDTRHLKITPFQNEMLVRKTPSKKVSVSF